MWTCDFIDGYNVFNSETNEKRTFETATQAEWFVKTGESLSAAQVARSMKVADKFSDTLASVKAGSRAMFNAQQGPCFSGISLMRLRGDITIAPHPTTGVITVTINRTDEQLVALGLDRAEEEGGLAALYRVLTSVPEGDSSAIALFMD